jgi:hypothetical protein
MKLFGVSGGGEAQELFQGCPHGGQGMKGSRMRMTDVGQQALSSLQWESNRVLFEFSILLVAFWIFWVHAVFGYLSV